MRMSLRIAAIRWAPDAAKRLEDLLGAVQHSGLQVVLRRARNPACSRWLGSSDSRVAMFWWILIARSTSPRRAIEAPEREMRLDRVVVQLRCAQEGFQRPVRLLVDQEVHAGEVVAAQAFLADGAGPRLARGVETDERRRGTGLQQDPDRFRIHGVAPRRLAPWGGWLRIG